ncbi:hypothetical protein AB1N83_003887 [Pleurotus pulmonarius]
MKANILLSTDIRPPASILPSSLFLQPSQSTCATSFISLRAILAGTAAFIATRRWTAIAPLVFSVSGMDLGSESMHARPPAPKSLKMISHTRPALFHGHVIGVYLPARSEKSEHPQCFAVLD